MASVMEGNTKTCSMGMMLITLITVTSKLTRMTVRAREWEGLFLGLLIITNFGWVRFRLNSSPRQHCNCSIASHRQAKHQIQTQRMHARATRGLKLTKKDSMACTRKLAQGIERRQDFHLVFMSHRDQDSKCVCVPVCLSPACVSASWFPAHKSHVSTRHFTSLLS
jgi:hypothetical protein